MSTDMFQQYAADWILKPDVEGGYSDRRNDRGGATNLGISIHLLDLLPDGDDDGFLDGDIDRNGTIDIEDIHAMDDDAALDIYYRYFWKPNHCEQLPPAIALCLFDGLVNHQPRPARRLLQMGLGIPDGHVDGIVGQETIRYAHQADRRYFLIRYLSYRAQFYADIVRADSTQAANERGWYARLFRLQQYTLENTS